MFTVLLKRGRDFVFSVVSLAVSVFWAIFAFSYPRDSSAFPRILCIALILLSLAMLYRSLRINIDDSAGGEEGAIFSKKTILFYLLCGLYVLALAKIGFYVASYFYVVGICLFLNYRHKVVVLVWPAILCLLLYLIFSCFLHVPTPEGILF